MKKGTFHTGMVLFFITLLFGVNARAEEVLINDILINPAQYWNMKVTLVGEVQNVNADPAGTTRGTYTFLDDSCSNTITIRTKDLPPVGHAFRVTGQVLQVPEFGNVPVIRELNRTDVGEFSTSTRSLLIGLGAILVILIVIFIILLLKLKKNVPAQPTPAAVSQPGTEPEAPKGANSIPTVAIPTPVPQGDETQLLQNPLAELLVEQGFDKGMVFTICKNTNTIGRSGARVNDVVLTDNTVSKAQATLHFDPVSGHFSIVNDGTKNPTKVNGAVAVQQVPLSGGELIEMGKTVLRFKKL
ncbi:MAG: FHA domain-containing protein [Candidatus Aminicenantes bacterium]|nr:FHA domain-containing protein [Candidatus Aminicenantes bacterium]